MYINKHGTAIIINHGTPTKLRRRNYKAPASQFLDLFADNDGVFLRQPLPTIGLIVESTIVFVGVPVYTAEHLSAPAHASG